MVTSGYAIRFGKAGGGNEKKEGNRYLRYVGQFTCIRHPAAVDFWRYRRPAPR
jgi:hypothetical protein